MGVFSPGNFNNAGKGVDINGPQKRRFFVFFDLLAEKFWTLVQINLLFVAFVAILAVPAFFVYSQTENTILSLAVFSPITICVPGIAYLTKRIACDESIFIVHDFFEKIKENISKTLVFSFINLSLFLILSYLLPRYYAMAQENIIMYVVFFLCCTFTLVYVFMQYYMYLFTVVFDLKTKDIIINSVIFAIANMWVNLFITLVIGVIVFFSLYGLELIETPIIGGIVIILAIFVLFSFFSYLTNFLVWPKVKKLLIDPYADKFKKDEPEKILSYVPLEEKKEVRDDEEKK